MRLNFWIAACATATVATLQGQQSGVTLPKGVELKALATFESQQVTSPVSLAFDDQGRLFVVETHRFTKHGVEDDREHLEWYLDDLASNSVVDRLKMIEKWQSKTPLSQYTERSERVRLLSDPDADGVYRSSKVFAEDFKGVLDGTASGILPHEGTVFFGCIPKIYTLRDDNHDGVAEQRETLADGFGVKVSLSGHDQHGFTLGPDGRIYGTIGDRGMQVKTREGRTIDLPDQGAVFRFEPDGTNFEVVHQGLRNPKGLAFDETGNAIVVDNNSDQGDQARIVYIAEGGDSGWVMGHQALHSFGQQIGLSEPPLRSWMDESMWAPANSAQPAFLLPPVANLTAGPSGVAYHPGCGFLDGEAGHFFVGDYGGAFANSGVWSFKLAADGAGMKLAESHKLLWGVAVTDLAIAPDGRLTMSDFGGGWATHDAGRVVALNAGANTWRASEAAEAAALMRDGFEQRSSQELQALLRHVDWRVRLRAELALTRKGDALARFAESVRSADAHERLHAVWGLGVVARRGSAMLPVSKDTVQVKPDKQLCEQAARVLAGLIKHPDAELRAQAIRSLGDFDARRSPASPAGVDLKLADWLNDASPRVRAFAAITLGKLQQPVVVAVVEKIAAEKNPDPYLRHAYAFALAHLQSPAELVWLAGHESPAVRMAGVVALRQLRAVELRTFLEDKDLRISDEAVRAIHDLGLDGARPAVAALLDRADAAKRSPLMLHRLVHSAFRVGGEENLQRLVKVSLNKSLPESARAEAVRLLGLWAEPPVVDQSTGRWAPLPKRDAAPVVASMKQYLPQWAKGANDVQAAAMLAMTRYEGADAGLTDEALRRCIENRELSQESREAGFQCYVKRGGKDVQALCDVVLNAKNDPLFASAARHWLTINQAKALPVVLRMAVRGSGMQRQAAWKAVAGIDPALLKTALVDGLKALEPTRGVSASALELLEIARKSTLPEVVAAVKSYEATWQGDPIGAWLPELEGGDAKRGEKVVYGSPAAQCMRCHGGFETGGPAVGPNLGKIEQLRTRRQLLESILDPSAALSPAYGKVTLKLKNKQSISGSVTAEKPSSYEVTTDQKVVTLRKSDVVSVTPDGPMISPMPPMKFLLTAEERRDVVAWLASDKSPSVKPAKAKDGAAGKGGH